MTRRSPAPGYPEATAVDDHLVIDKTEWVPGADPEPHRRDPDQVAYPESYFYCLRCGIGALRLRDLPPTCDADRGETTDHDGDAMGNPDGTMTDDRATDDPVGTMTDDPNGPTPNDPDRAAIDAPEGRAD